MNHLDAFSGLTWGDLSRYKVRNDTAVRDKRAQDLDLRIKNLTAKSKTVSWAYEAVAFCDSETKQNQDIFAISKEAHRLPQIKEEASGIIKKENDRIAADKRAFAANADAAIQSLAGAERSSQWCDQVKDLNTKIKEAGTDVQAMIKKLDQLKKLVQEADLLIEAAHIDQRIRDLMKASKKDEAWLTLVDTLNKDITAKITPLLKEGKLRAKLQEEYLRVQKKPIYSPYDKCLKQIEGGKWTEKAVRDDFDSLDKKLANQKILMQDYISDFTARWSKARTQVSNENKRAAEEEAKRKQAAIDKENKSKLSAYVNHLKLIETGGVSPKYVREQFAKYDASLQSLKFSHDQYEQNFTQRWNEARNRVNAENKRVAEEERLAEQRRIAERAKAARAERARELCKDILLGIPSILSYVVIYAVISAIMGFGFSWAMGLGQKFYTLFITAACSMSLVHVCCRESYEPYNLKAIIGQIVLYINVILFSLLFGYGVFNMIVCCGAVAAITNGYVRMIESDTPWIRYLQSVGTILGAAGMILGTEYWLSAKVMESFWNAWWLVPVIVFLVMMICSLSAMVFDDEDFSMIYSIPFGLAVLIRSIGVVCGITGFNFGMFFFIVIQIVLAAVAGCISIGISVYINDELY